MSTHIVACLLLYRHREVRVALCVLLFFFLWFYFNEILCSFAPHMLPPSFNFLSKPSKHS